MSEPASSGISFYHHIVAKLHAESLAREDAWTHDKWLTLVREQQGSERRAREQSARQSAQKMQSIIFPV